MIDASIDGALINKTFEIVYRLLKELVSNNCQWPFEKAWLKPMAKVLEFDRVGNFASQLATINKNLDRLSVNFLSKLLSCVELV